MPEPNAPQRPSVGLWRVDLLDGFQNGGLSSTRPFSGFLKRIHGLFPIVQWEPLRHIHRETRRAQAENAEAEPENGPPWSCEPGRAVITVGGHRVPTLYRIPDLAQHHRRTNIRGEREGGTPSQGGSTLELFQ
jgi:hypothetical protein